MTEILNGNFKSKKWLDFLINLSLLLGSLIFLLFCIEIVIRILPALKAGPPSYYRQDIGRVYQPNYKGIFKNRDTQTSVQINSQGFRDVEHSVNKNKEIFRIVVLGDSFTAQLHLPFDETYTEMLEDEIANNGKKVEIINLGIDGTGEVHQAEILKKLGINYEPDLILHQVFLGNDIIDNYNEAAVDSNMIEPKKGSGGLVRNIKNLFFKNLKFYQFLVERIHRVRSIEVPLVRLGLISPPGDLTPSGISLLYFVYADNDFLKQYDSVNWEKYNKAWQVTRDAFSQIKQIADEKNIPYFVVVFPDKPDVYAEQDKDQFLSIYKNMSQVKWDMNTPHIKIKKIFNDLNIDYLDPIDDLRVKVKSDVVPLYFKFDGHFNTVGNKYIANALYNAMGKFIK